MVDTKENILIMTMGSICITLELKRKGYRAVYAVRKDKTFWRY